MEFIKKLDYILTHDNTQITKNGYEVVKERSVENVGKQLKKVYIIDEIYRENLNKMTECYT